MPQTLVTAKFIPPFRLPDGAVASLSVAAWLPGPLLELDLSDKMALKGPLYNTRLGRDGGAWSKLAGAQLHGLRRLDLRWMALGEKAAGQLVGAG